MGNVTLIAGPRDGATGDVVFVHGIDSQSATAWGTEVPWLAWLADDLGSARIWTLDYETQLSDWQGNRGAVRLPDLAVRSLARLHVSVESKALPLCFVCHSMGGLVVKEMLRTALTNTQPEYRPLMERTRGVAFIATPHLGANVVALATFLRFAFRPSGQTLNLEAHDSHLRALDTWYRNNVKTARISTMALVESMPYMGKIIVEAGFADPHRENAVVVTMPANHIEVAKPRSRTDDVYQQLLMFLKGSLHAPAPLVPEHVDSELPSGTRETLKNVLRAHHADLDKGLRVAQNYAIILKYEFNESEYVNPDWRGPVNFNSEDSEDIVRSMTSYEVAELQEAERLVSQFEADLRVQPTLLESLRTALKLTDELRKAAKAFSTLQLPRSGELTFIALMKKRIEYTDRHPGPIGLTEIERTAYAELMGRFNADTLSELASNPDYIEAMREAAALVCKCATSLETSASTALRELSSQMIRLGV